MPNFNSDRTPEEIQRDSLNKAAKIIHEKYGDVVWCLEHGAFYQYDGIIWRKIPDIKFINLISSRFPSFDEFPVSRKKEIVENFKYFSHIEASDFNKIDGFNFLNGFFKLSDLSLTPHKKENYSTIVLPYKCNSKDKCPLWEKSLMQIFEGDINKIKVLQEFFGYCLTKDTSMQKCLIMIGDGANGKSLILDTLNNMLGAENISILSLKYINDSSRLGSLEGKLVNICNEISKSIKDFEEEFKKIIDGDAIEVNPKYILPYKIKPFCKMIFAINDFPYIEDKTHAFYRRLLILNFDKIFAEEEQNKKLEDQLMFELPGIFNWSLEGLERLNDRGFFVVNEYMKRMVDDLKVENNPILLFCRDNIKVQNESHLIKHEVYKRYCDWCLVNGYKPLSSQRFGKEFFKVYKHATKKDGLVGKEDDRQRVWINLNWYNQYKKQKEVDW